MANAGQQPVPGASRYRVNAGVAYLQNASLTSKVAKFNEKATTHKEVQQHNPFSQPGRAAKRVFNKGEYGKPVAGSLTEFRGQKANIQVSKEVLQLCEIIDSEGFPASEEDPDLKVILFGDLFQRRDDDVPIFLLKPIDEIRRIVGDKQEEVFNCMSSNPKPTTILQDHLKNAK